MGDVADTTEVRTNRMKTAWDELKISWGEFLNNSDLIQGGIGAISYALQKAGEKIPWYTKLWNILNFAMHPAGTGILSNETEKLIKENANKNTVSAQTFDQLMKSGLGLKEGGALNVEKIKTLKTLNEELAKEKENLENINELDLEGRQISNQRIKDLNDRIKAIQTLREANLGAGLTPIAGITGANIKFPIGEDFFSEKYTEALKGKAPLAPLKEALIGNLNEIQQIMIDAKKNLVATAMDMLEGLFTAMSSGNWSDFGKGLLTGFANFLSMLGKLLVSFGIGMQAFQTAIASMNPFVAIGAGLAMIAVAGLIKGAISRGAQTVYSGAAGGGGATSAGRGELNNIRVIVEGKISGKDIHISNRRYIDTSNKST
jgi:hypothetical protein